MYIDDRQYNMITYKRHTTYDVKLILICSCHILTVLVDHDFLWDLMKCTITHTYEQNTQTDQLPQTTRPPLRIHTQHPNISHCKPLYTTHILFILYSQHILAPDHHTPPILLLPYSQHILALNHPYYRVVQKKPNRNFV